MKSDSSLPGENTLADTAASKSESFYKLTGSELKQFYKDKLLDAPLYVLLIVKTHGKAGWKWTFKVKDFCREWGIGERTFYRAISKLKTLELLHWQAQGSITVWYGTDIAPCCNDISTNTLTPVSVTKDICTKLQTPVSVPLSRVSIPLSRVSVPMTPVSQQMAETLVSTETAEASDLNQIIQSNTHIAALASATPAPHPDVCIRSEVDKQREERSQSTISEAVEVKADQDLGFVGELIKDLAQRKDLIQDTSAAAEKSKKSKNTQSTRIKWECPGTADEKLEFLKWKGALLANLGKTSIAEAESAALGWANKHPEEATLAYDGWKREINQEQTPAPKPSHSVLFAAPSFETMPLSQHEALVRAYVAEGEEAFKAREVWHSDWLKFAKQYLNRVFKKVAQETP